MSIVEKSTGADAASPSELDSISKQLVAARLNAEALPEFPGVVPRSLDDAYTVQMASIERWPDAIGGWKVGMIPAEFRDELGAERLCGPIYQSSISEIAPGAHKSLPIFHGGFAAIEAEFVFCIGTTIEPIPHERSDADLIELVASLHVGAEMASSPMADVNRLGPCCVVSDFGNNAGLLVGPAIPNWSTVAPDTLTAAVQVDGALVGTATANAIDGGLLSALRFLVDLSAKRGLVLPAGTYVSCGALTGIHDVTVNSTSEVDFGDFGTFAVGYEAMTPLKDRPALAKV
ncbi:MAG: 2-keto-4-pentenoate hydratase [Woeseiaceae bacterium]